MNPGGQRRLAAPFRELAPDVDEDILRELRRPGARPAHAHAQREDATRVLAVDALERTLVSGRGRAGKRELACAVAGTGLEVCRASGHLRGIGRRTADKRLSSTMSGELTISLNFVRRYIWLSA